MDFAVSELYFDIDWMQIGKLALAMLFGAIIGVERDIHGRAAGMRTHMLVCAGACLFTIASIAMTSGDPGRIAAQIVAGIGFLGAGAILKSGFTVRGLTTAACMWLSSAVGITCGMGNVVPAVIATCATLLILLVCKRIENKLTRLSAFHLEVESSEDNFRPEVLRKIRFECDRFTLNSMHMEFVNGIYRYEFEFDAHMGESQAETIEFLMRRLRELRPDLKHISLKCLS
jgi:putative Mg2+ transporter-C (MgtC) family protein